MFDTQTQAISKQRISIAEVLISLGLFLLALLPRAYDLQRFVTADEAKWVYRSAQFLDALLNGDFAATSVNLTPAVTTTWLGSLGLTIYYYLNQAVIDLSFNDWLLTQPEFRVELPVLVAVRWPMVIFATSSVVVIYWLARRLFNGWLSFLGATFIALDAHTVALSRILGHDAPVAIFIIISLLLLLLAVKNVTEDAIPDMPPSNSPQRGENWLASPPKGGIWGGLFARLSITAKDVIHRQTFWLILSGVAAGLAFLSKSPAFFLIPFTILVMLSLLAVNQNISLLQGIKWMAVWGVAVYLAFVVLWPAAWVDPVGQLWAVIHNAFLSATDQVGAEAEGYWLVPNLGPFYYLVNGAFKLSLLVTIGTVLAIIFSIISFRQNGHIPKPSIRNTQYAICIIQNFVQNLGRSPLFWLALFTLLFTIFMTLGGKRSSRYILPIFPALAFIAAYGWLQLLSAIPKLRAPHSALRISFIIILTIISVFTLLPYAPYYFTYYNPLLGGAYTAPSLVKIGWGEGLDRVGRFLQRELPHSRVGTAYASTVAAYFKGDISAVDGDRLDYVVLYSKQVQSGEPSPSFIRYFEQTGNSIFSVELNGIHYADIYPGPAPQPVATIAEESDHQMPRPVSYRPYSPYGNIGQPLEIDIIWDAADPLPATPVTVTLAPLNSIKDGPSDSVRFDEDLPGLAAAEGTLTRLDQALVVSRHRLMLPEELERGVYALLLDGQPIGEIEVRHFELPSRMGGVRNVVFDEQIGLVGYNFYPTEDYISVTIAWQAQKSSLPDYTVFAQYIDVATGERVAGIDTQPVKGQWPTSRWVKGEIVVDEYLVAMPPGLKPGFYGVMVGLYHPETGQRLVRANGQDFWPLPFTFIHK